MRHDVSKRGRFGLGLWALALAAISTQVGAQEAKSEAPAEVSEIVAGATEYMVPMRDGIELATNVFLPEGDGPFPTVFQRTPYEKDGRMYASMNRRYTSAGYALVVQDVRGMFRSGGEYRPFQDDREDGFDSVSWINTQSWCDGNIGMSGASAMGITANLAATMNPPGLKAAYIVVAPQSMFDQSTFINGVFKEADVGNWLRRQGAGDRAAELQSRPIMDDEWREFDLIHFIDRIDIPMYNIAGWYDIFLQGGINNFVQLQNEGREGARGNQKLLVGPFGHGNLSGDLSYGRDGSMIAGFSEELRWFDHWLKGEANGIMDEPPIKYYMMASARKKARSEANEYRTADNWPPAHTPTRFYLAEGGSLSRDSSGTDGSSTTYQFDPANPVPTIGGANLTLDRGPMDQREVGERSDYLRFETSHLTEDVVIAGPVSVELWVSTDGPDTDFMVKLVDVYPDGYEALLLDSPFRTRYRKGRNPEDVEMMTPGKPELLNINLWSTAITFEKGHRIAVHVTSSNAPRFEINPNNGDLPRAGEQEMRIAENTVHHDSAHPSAIILPVVLPEASMIADPTTAEGESAAQ